MPGIQINSLQDLLMLRSLRNQADPTYSAMSALADGVAVGIAEEQEKQRKAKAQAEANQATIDFVKKANIGSTGDTNTEKVGNLFETKIKVEGGVPTITASSIDEGERLSRAKARKDLAGPTKIQTEAAKVGIPTPRSGKEVDDIASGDFDLLNKIAEQNRIKSEQDALAKQKELEVAEQARVAKTVNDIDDDIRSTKSIQDYSTIERSGANIQSAYERAVNADTTSKNAADQALIVSFNKMLDPGSVVRESEYARTPAGEAFIKQIEGRLKQLRVGGAGLTDSSRKEILKMTQDLVNNAREFARRDIDVYRKRAEAFNVPVDLLYGGFLKDDVIEGQTSSGNTFRRVQ
jgi:hypothetical protein